MPEFQTPTPAAPAAIITSSATRTVAGQSFPASKVIADKKMEIKGKTFFFDVIENAYGRALRICEKTQSKRNRIVIPQEHFQDFAGVCMDMMAEATKGTAPANV